MKGTAGLALEVPGTCLSGEHLLDMQFLVASATGILLIIGSNTPVYYYKELVFEAHFM